MSLNKGFLLTEILLALGVLTILVVSIGSILHVYEVRIFESERLIELSEILNQRKGEILYKAKNNFLSVKSSQNENFEELIRESVQVEYVKNFLKSVTLKVSDMNSNSIVQDKLLISDSKNGQNSVPCNISPTSTILSLGEIQEIDLGENIFATGLDIRNGYIYVSSDSASTSKEDFFIYSNADENEVELLSKINTGPGLMDVEVSGDYAYVANSSINSQLQIINISDKSNPQVLSNLKVSDSAISGVSLTYYKDYLYLGTEKSASSGELFVVDVSDVYHPNVISSYELNTQVSGIHPYYDRLFVATPGQIHLHVFDISNPSDIGKVGVFSSLGWQAQDGKSVYIFGDTLYFGKTVGGFNNPNYHELISFDLDNFPDFSSVFAEPEMSLDTAASVNAVVGNGKNIIIALGEPLRKLTMPIYLREEFMFDSAPIDAVCYLDKIYVALKSRYGLKIIKPIHEN